MLKIDSEAMYKGLQTALLVECETLTNWIWAQVQGQAPAEVDRDVIFQEVVVMGSYVCGTVEAHGMQALITEWGSGSLADTSNPAWDEYTRSGYWNPARDPGRHTIRGRPAGEYTDLDNQQRVSSGGRAGINLEWKYLPIPAQHWLEGIVERSRPYVLERLVQMVQAFPFHNYIYSDGR